MGNIVFAAISPHPPIILPSVGSKEDHLQVKKTIGSLENLGKKLKELNPDSIIISAPHPDWGFNVPLYFLAKDFKGKIETFLIGTEPPHFYFQKGKNLYPKLVRGPSSNQTSDQKVALIASGDLSHCLKENGPYGFNPDGPKFDEELILKEKGYREDFKIR
jgi:aromatic ring-opening dioxygenase LigB subunit